MMDERERTRKMQFITPQFLTLIGIFPKIKIVQAMVHPLIVTSHYRTEQERLALQNGVPPEEAKDIGMIGDLNPGTTNIIYHLIGIQLKELDKEKNMNVKKLKSYKPFLKESMQMSLIAAIATDEFTLVNKEHLLPTVSYSMIVRYHN
ncbi:hypothetical protein BD770DRAFT_412844 [Pilaira anomala]|nr:hypothetical protein BD770DRAFT_412844 [Pilaira anomala]